MILAWFVLYLKTLSAVLAVLIVSEKYIKLSIDNLISQSLEAPNVILSFNNTIIELTLLCLFWYDR